MIWKGKINFELRPQLNGSNIILTENAGEINALTDKALPVSNDVIIIEDSAASYAKKKATIGSFAPPFGTYYQSTENETEASTNSTTPQTRLTLSPTGLPSGTYRVGWFFNWSLSSSSYDFRGRVTVNGVQNAYMSQEPKDPGTDQNVPASGFFPIALSGNPTILLQYWVENSGVTGYIRNARLEFWRIL
jgi:hypothetical protein